MSTSIKERDDGDERDLDHEVYRLGKCANCQQVRLVSDRSELCPQCGK